MSNGVSCGQCGEPITGEPPGLDRAQRQPCPKCGSTDRTSPMTASITISSSLTAHATVVTYPETLLAVARWLIDEGQFGIAIVVVHMACEIATERSLSEAFKTKGISYLEDSVMEFVSGHNLATNRIRKLYTALTEDHVEKAAFWQECKKSAERRNKIVHSTITVTKAEAEDSPEVQAVFCRRRHRPRRPRSPRSDPAVPRRRWGPEIKFHHVPGGT